MYVKNSIKRVTEILVILLFVFSASYSNTAVAGTSVVQTFYVPITEEQIRTWETGIYGGTIGNDVNTVLSITATYDGTIIYYDQWEDGYEDDISNPVQSTTQKWGDGNAANGAPPGCTINACDIVNAGTVIPLNNIIPANPRDQGNIFFDARDKFSSTGQLVVTRSGWATNPGTVFAGAVEVFDTRKWSTSYESPIGTNSPGGVVGNMFTYTALSILAKDNNTLVQVDSNADGTVDITRTLNQGESMIVTNILQGSTVNSSAPVQVDLMTGQTGSNVVGRWFSLIPKNQWSSSYYSPVMTISGNPQINSVILYNPDPAATITVNIDTAAGPQAPINISPRQVARFNLTTSGAHFYTSGAPFFGVLIGDYNSNTGATYEWGAMLVPEQDLTPSVIIGWAPGSDGTPPTQNISPVWVTAVANTTLYVDYDGNPATGSLTDSLGNHYDVSYPVNALESLRIYDTDHDMTGARIYTVSGTRIAAVWGQDSSNGVTASPALDLGTAVLPFPSLTAYKTAALIGDFNNNGGLDAGELLQYTIRINNSGIYPITNITLTDALDADVTYVADTSTISGSAIADDVSPKTRFPFDDTGYMIVTSPSVLNPGDDIYITFQVTANNPLPLSKVAINNNAKVSSIAEIFLNTQTEVVRQGALQTTMTSSIAPGKVKPGDTITYTVTVKNISSVSQTGIQLSGPLPAGTSYIANTTTVTGPRLKSVIDKFNVLSYGNNNGPESWAGNWSESDATQDPLSGNVQVINGALRLVSSGSWAARTVNLTTGITGQDFTSATLSFDFRTGPTVVAGDTVVAEISNNGTTFNTLETFTNITGQTSGTRSYDISSSISANTTVRFRVTSSGGINHYFYADNIAIKTNELPSVTKDNISGGTYADLLNGVPPGIIMPGDGFALAPNETMTVIYSVLADNPLNVTRIVNTVTATSQEKAPPSTATTIDPTSTGGTIGDLVWLDTVVNGTYDSGEPGLYNVRVWLDTNNNNVFDSGVDFETRTGTDGKYIFGGLLPGTYKVFVDETTMPAGLISTTGTVNPSAAITITGEDTVLGTDFGYKTADSSVAIIGNYIWSDANNNGVQDSGEVGIGGVTVELKTSPGGAVVQTATTNAFGIYLFTNVSAGTYTVTVTDTANKLSGYTATTGLQSLGKAVGVPSDPLTVAGGNSYMMMDSGFYNSSLFSISNKLWFDSNNNASLDTGEPGIKDVTITLLDSTGNVTGSSVSDVNGSFSFTGVPNGSYTIKIEDATGKLIGFAGTTAAAKSGALAVTVSGSDVSGTAFGFNAPGRIGDTVWKDLNRNGIQNAGEPGIQGVTVQLYKDTNGDGLFNPAVDQLAATTTTDSNGNYMFQVSEAGRFFVNIDNTQSALSGLTLTTIDDETYQGVQIQVDFLNLNTSLLTADFGFGSPATIEGVVWNDTNRNGSGDSGETGIQGVSVKLYKDTDSDGLFNPASDQLLSTLITDSNGHYAFPVTEAGRFFISVDANQTPLIGKTLTTGDDQAYAGAQITVVLPNVDTFYTNGNFGYAAPAPSALTVTKTSNPSGNVTPGGTITYTVTVTNTSATRQTGIRVNDPLPANTAYIANSTSATGPLPPSSSTISDNFETGGYSGGSGWSGNWAELSDDGNPTNGDVRVATDLGDLSARIRQSGNGLSRPVNLSACTSATMTFDYRRQGFDGASDYVAFSVNNGTSWNEVTRFTGPGTDGNYIGSPVYNINSNTTQIRFLSSGLNNQDYFYFDNVQIICTVPKTTQTKTNQVSAPNPLSNGVPPDLVVPADSFILDQNDTLTVTFRVTVNNPLPDDVVSIINQATATSNESDPAVGSVTNLRPILQDLQVTKAIETISSPCTVGTCEVTYLVTVTNVGTNAETAVAVTDLLPTELTYLSHLASPGSYNNTNGIWSIGNISSGNSATLRITARVTSDSSSIQNCASLTASTPADTNPANNTGCVSITPTSVILSDFSAYTDNGRVVIEWSTASENNTAGFYLLRKDDTSGEYQLINNGLLPALLTSPQGGTYSLIDNGASPDKSYTYILMEIQGKGKKNVYGPFTVQAGVSGYMDKQGVSNTVSPDALFNKSKVLKSFSAQINKHINKDGVLVITNKISSTQGNTPYGGFSNYTRKAKDTSDSREALLKAMKENRESLAHISKLPAGNNGPLKISVSQDGLYSVSVSAISAALGQPVWTIRNNIFRNMVSLTSQGQSVAYTISKDYSKILFYGHGIDSIYSDENIYWLSLEKGLKMQKGPRGSVAAPVGSNITFTDTVHTEKDAVIVPVLFNDPEADYWFWDIVVSGYPEYDSKSFTIQANGAANTSSEATLNANLYGFTETGVNADYPDRHEHHAMIYLNDNPDPIGESEWDGAQPHTVTLHFDQSLLRNGANTVTVKGILNDKVPYSEFWIDSFDLTYERVYQAVDNALICRGNGNPVVTITGFTGPDILLLDITDSMRPKIVNAATITRTNGLYSVKFTPLSPETVYLAVLNGAETAVSELNTGKSTGLMDKSNNADYLIITTPELVNASQSLADYRKAQGLIPKIIVLENIMNEFNYGIYDPRAIRDFLSYAYYNWTKPPKYVVLAGNGTYDYKDNMDRGDNLIPPLMTDTTMGLYASDNLYSVFDGDPVPMIAIGRLPVLTAGELQDIIAKIISYESGTGTNALLLADDPDDGGNFPDDSDAVAPLLLQRYTVDKIYLSQHPVAEANSMLLDKINSGAVFLNYIGHAGPDRLAFEGLLTKDDISLRMNNAGGTHVLAAMTCLAGQFAIPGFDSLSESLVLKKDGGSAAVWAPTGYSYNWLARILDEEFLKAAFGAPKTVLGNAILNAFREYNIAGGQPFMINIYTLFGDPALKLR